MSVGLVPQRGGSVESGFTGIHVFHAHYAFHAYLWARSRVFPFPLVLIHYVHPYHSY